MLAIMTVRDLPAEQRAIWEDVFHHYAFAPGEMTDGHIPANARRVLGPLDETKARAMRARLLQRLNR
ncbi:MAG TPA: cupin-like domain-containing protein, partial [Pseudoxanthomonas sp.]|nr:cupin-like domain-containing protein [Pseudoxanthomonas sp.]